jgi:parallel beta-helix repeat protein
MRMNGKIGVIIGLTLIVSVLAVVAAVPINWYDAAKTKGAIVQSAEIVVPDDYPTIQAAINAASDGDTIFVRSGTYYENVVVNKAVWLVGEDMATAIIDGNSTGYCVEIQSNGAVLENFTLENGDLVDVMVNQNVSQVVIENNLMINSDWGIYLSESSNNTIERNLVENCGSAGIFLESSSYNMIIGNTVVNNSEGIVLTAAPHIPEVPPVPSTFNAAYHNNLLNNSVQALIYGVGNRWDDGYPSGGNYWSDYTGEDVKSGPNQDQPGSDGIGDTPYVIDVSNQDNYPLMNPWLPPSTHDVAIIGVVASKAVIGQGLNGNITVYGANIGGYFETFDVTVYANATPINSTSLPLNSGSDVMITFTWNTSGFAKGNYTISAYALPVSGETNTTNNNCTDGWVIVAIAGDVTGQKGVPDGQVNLMDVYKVAMQFGSSAPTWDPYWGPVCDVNNDGTVNLIDYYRVCMCFGQTDP